MMSTQRRPIAPRAKISWCFSPDAAALPGRLGTSLSRRTKRSERRCEEAARSILREGGVAALGCVLDVGLGAVAAGGGFAVPFAVRRLVFDRLGAAGNALLGGGALGGGKRCGMGREGFRKHAVDGVGPAAVMLNDLVGDEGHDELACFAGSGPATG